MGKGSENTILVDGSDSRSTQNQVKSACPNDIFFTWKQVEQHSNKHDCWIVVNECIYDLTKFKATHPGGSKLIDHYAGQDATEAFTAFHKDFDKIMKYAKLYQIGRIDPRYSRVTNENLIIDQTSYNEEIDHLAKEASLKNDFEALRKLAIKMNLFAPSYFFFVSQAVQILFFHILGYYILWNYGCSPMSLICASISLIVAQVKIRKTSIFFPRIFN